MSTVTALVARPFESTGRILRLTSSMLWARGRGWTFMWNRSRIDYRAEVGDPAANSIVGAVVGWISRNFPDAPVRIVREDQPDGPPIRRSATGPGAMLRLLERPNRFFSGVLQWMATVVDYVTDGNAYWLKVRNGAGRVVELWWVPQKFMEPRWPQDEQPSTTFIGWYELTLDGLRYEVDPANVIHFRNGLDPDNTRKGRAPLKSLFREIFTDEEAATFTASLLRNLGVPGVVIAPANTTGAQKLNADPEVIKQKFMDKFGGESRGEPLVLTAPTDVKVLSFNPQQMELKALRRIPEERVSAVLGVPAGVAGLGAGLDRNTFTNYGEANKAAYTQAVIPLQRLIAAELEVQLLPEFVANALELYDVFFDASVTQAMAEAAGEVWKRAESSATKGLITRADFKRIVGRKPATDGSDDVYIRPNNFLVTPAGEREQTPAGTTPRQLAPGAEAAQLTAGPEAGPVRCTACDRLLAEMAAPPYRFTCRCKAVTEAQLEASAA